MKQQCRFAGMILILGMSSLVLAQEAATKIAPATTKVVKTVLPNLQSVDARIEAVHQATVSAQVSGRIIEINVDVDDYVQKGMVILRLRDKEQQAAFDSAKARFDEANKEYERMKDIFAKGLVAKAAVDSAEAKYKAAKGDLDRAQEALENTRIRAPYSGIVVKRFVQVGEMAHVGMPLMTGLSLEKLRAVVEVPQSMIYQVRQRKQAWLLLDGNGQRRVAAESLQISPYADPESHTFTVKLNLAAGDHGIYPGMHAEVLFTTGEQEGLLIPQKAVAHRSEVSGVYVKTQTGVQFRQIRLGQKRPDDRVEVLAGVREGEEILLDPVNAAALIQSAVQ